MGKTEPESPFKDSSTHAFHLLNHRPALHILQARGTGESLLMRIILLLALTFALCGCTTHPSGSTFAVPNYSTPRLWTVGGSTWKLVSLTYSADGGVAASYRLPSEVSKKTFTELIGFRLFRSKGRVEDFIQGLESIREFDKELTIEKSQLDDEAWLVTHYSPLWDEHGVALFVAGPQEGFLFYYTTRRAAGFQEAIDRWTKLLMGPRQFKVRNQPLGPTMTAVERQPLLLP